jgi:hypothetical protein
VLLVALAVVAVGVVAMFPSNGFDLSDLGERLIIIGGLVGIAAIAAMVALARHGRRS